ncbi:MAG: mandelate racemase/muconate lactonizing enzyme family protein [Planctomycetota bacterium]|nr:mandelate racemase/muconate lactonizing enzyme family protein [Planctomycetota bacterium]
MKNSAVSMWLVEVPQIAPIAPYRSHVRTSSTTTKAITRIDTDEGLYGWGECNLNFLPGLDLNRMRKQATEWTVGRDPLNISSFHRNCPFDSRLKSGLELAMWDIAGKAAGMSVAQLLGGVIREEIELAACMGIQTYERAGEIASLYVEQGFTTLKTKAGSDAQEDLDMVRGIRDAVGGRLKLRIDPNRAYTPQQAAELAKQLEDYDLEYFEQPIPAEPLSDARWLREQTSVPIALNESVVGPDTVMSIFLAGAASHILPDTHIAGGILPCVKIGHLCEAADIPCIMHCGHDLGPKTAAMLHIAAACPAYSLANDCTYFGLADDILKEPFTIQNGRMRVPTAPGLGIDGDVEKLEYYSIG